MTNFQALVVVGYAVSPTHFVNIGGVTHNCGLCLCVSVSVVGASESVLAAPARTGENPADTVLGVLWEF